MDIEYILRRFAFMFLSLFVILSLIFFLFRQVPGGPSARLMSEQLSEQSRAALRAQYGLDKPIHKQYFLYIKNVFQLEFGRSFYYNRPVVEIIQDRFVNTLSLMFSALTVSYVVGTYLGAQLALVRGSKLERAEIVVVLLLRSTPVFWTGLVLLYIFSFELGWFPIGGMRSVTATYSGQFELFLSVDFFKHLVLPLVALSIFYTGLPLLLMRNNMLEILSANFMDTARAKGLSNWRVAIHHAARNAILPVITAFSVAMGAAVGGQVLIETVFSWPGLGREIVRASLQTDYPLVQAVFTLLAATVIFMNIVADIAYTYLDPRVSVGER